MVEAFTTLPHRSPTRDPSRAAPLYLRHRRRSQPLSPSIRRRTRRLPPPHTGRRVAHERTTAHPPHAPRARTPRTPSRRKRPYNTRPQSPGPRLGGGLHYHTKPLTRRVRRIGSGALPRLIISGGQPYVAPDHPDPPWSHPPVIGGVASPPARRTPRGVGFRPLTGLRSPGWPNAPLAPSPTTTTTNPPPLGRGTACLGGIQNIPAGIYLPQSRPHIIA